MSTKTPPTLEETELFKSFKATMGMTDEQRMWSLWFSKRDPQEWVDFINAYLSKSASPEYKLLIVEA